MTIRVTHIFAASMANGISSIVTPISHPPISAPEARTWWDRMGKLDQRGARHNGEGSARLVGRLETFIAAREYVVRARRCRMRNFQKPRKRQ